MKRRNIALTSLLASALLLAGCASSPTPQFLGGYYYMAGDANCVQWRGTGAQIRCFDKQGNATGYRDAMTDWDLQQYQLQQQQAAMQRAELNRSLQGISQQWQAAGQQAMQQSQSWSAPQVQGIPSSGGAVGVNQAGNTLIGTDGSSCQIVGQSAICR